jgi:hypothetical protein
MNPSKCVKCGCEHAWSNLVISIKYKCQDCHYVNEYNKNSTNSYITKEEAEEYVKKRQEDWDKVSKKIEMAKGFSTGGLIPKSIHSTDALNYLTQCQNAFIPKGTPLFDSIKRQKDQQEYHDKTNYTFKTTCEEAVDLYKVAEDLNDQTYCLHVVTENTTLPNVNALLVHRSILHKASVLDISLPPDIETERYENFIVFNLFSYADGTEKPKSINYSDHKRVMKWIKTVRNAHWIFPKKVNGKPVTIKVTNCSVGR